MPTLPKKGWKYTGKYSLPVDPALHDKLIEVAEAMRLEILSQHKELHKLRNMYDENTEIKNELVKLRDQLSGYEDPVKKIRTQNAAIRSKLRIRQEELKQLNG